MPAGFNIKHSGGLLRQSFFDRIEMLLIGSSFLLADFQKQDAAAAQLVVFGQAVDDLADESNDIVLQAEGNAQLLTRLEELAGFQAKPHFTDIQGPGQPTPKTEGAGLKTVNALGALAPEAGCG